MICWISFKSAWFLITGGLHHDTQIYWFEPCQPFGTERKLRKNVSIQTSLFSLLLPSLTSGTHYRTQREQIWDTAGACVGVGCFLSAISCTSSSQSGCIFYDRCCSTGRGFYSGLTGLRTTPHQTVEDAALNLAFPSHILTAHPLRTGWPSRLGLIMPGDLGVAINILLGQASFVIG